MQAYFLRNLSELAHKRAVNIREEAALWDILGRDLVREAKRVEEKAASRPVMPRKDPPAPSPAQEPELYVRVPEAARMMGIGKSSLYREIAEGRLPIKKSGRKTLIATLDIQTWFENLPSK